VPYRAEGGEPFVIGKRRRPFGLDPLGEGKMPDRFILVRVQRFAVTEFSANPDLTFDSFKRRLAKHLFGSDEALAAAEDALALQEIWVHDSDWYWQNPVLDPEFLEVRARRLNWPTNKLAGYRQELQRLQGVAERYKTSTNAAELELQQAAQQVVERWRGKEDLLPRMPPTP
jgi:hypothetical protein